jgi:DNA polymerase III epsilon subunit-like protein
MPYPPLSERPLCFIDIESTGLDPKEHEIIEFAMVRELRDLDSLRERGVAFDGFVVRKQAKSDWLHWSTRIRPQHTENAEPEALAVNGYQEAEWAEEPLFEEVAPRIAELLWGCVLVGHNVGFDRNFLNHAFRRAGMDDVNLPHNCVDTLTLAYVHLVPRGLESLSFDRIREFLGWEIQKPHRALKDVLDCRRLFDELSGK